MISAANLRQECLLINQDKNQNKNNVSCRLVSIENLPELEHCKKDENSIDRYKRAVKRKLDVDDEIIDDSDHDLLLIS
jgi:hypothetical protein